MGTSELTLCVSVTNISSWSITHNHIWCRFQPPTEYPFCKELNFTETLLLSQRKVSLHNFVHTPLSDGTPIILLHNVLCNVKRESKLTNPINSEPSPHCFLLITHLFAFSIWNRKGRKMIKNLDETWFIMLVAWKRQQIEWQYLLCYWIVSSVKCWIDSNET